MTIYTYICENCDAKLEVVQSPSTYKRLRKCQECKKNTLVRDYGEDNVYCGDGTAKTLGSVAEQNTKPASYEYQDRVRQDKINDAMNKYEPQIRHGRISREEAEKKVEKLVDYKSPFGELPSDKKKNIFSGNVKEQQQKAKRYIEKGV